MNNDIHYNHTYKRKIRFQIYKKSVNRLNVADLIYRNDRIDSVEYVKRGIFCHRIRLNSGIQFYVKSDSLIEIIEINSKLGLS